MCFPVAIPRLRYHIGYAKPALGHAASFLASRYFSSCINISDTLSVMAWRTTTAPQITTRGNTVNLYQLYESMFVAERAWERELIAGFGDDAWQARYEKRGRGSFDDALGQAYLAKHKAAMAYFTAYHAAQVAA